MNIEEIKMPAFWASYLINGDDSSLTDEEVEHIDAYIKNQDILDVIDVSEEVHFSWAFSLYGGEASGGDLAEYTVRMKGI